MPIYEYECEQCRQVSEFFEKITAPPKTTCPHCNTDHLKRRISKTSFQLKGTGWYVTDFKNNDKKSEDNKTSTDKDDNSKPKDNSDKSDKSDNTSNQPSNATGKNNTSTTSNDKKKDKKSATTDSKT